MPLIAYNLTTSPHAIPHTSVTLPASLVTGVPGPAYNVTGELRGLTDPQYTNVANDAPGNVLYTWTGTGIEYSTHALKPETYGQVVDYPLHATVGSQFEVPQEFPATTAEVQALFPNATNVAIYLCNEASGNLHEVNGGDDLAPVSSPKYGLHTQPTFGATKKAVAIVDTGSSFQAVGNTSFDAPANGTFTILCVFRLENVRPGIQGLVTKLNGPPYHGYRIYFNAPGIGDSGHFIVDTYDGTTSVQALGVKQNYGYGAYHAVAVTWDGVAKTVTIRTDEESTSTSLAALDFTQFQIADPVCLGNLKLTNGWGLFGCIAYAAKFDGTITDQQFNNWWTHCTSTGLGGNLVYHPESFDGMSMTTYDFRDPNNLYVLKHGHDQFPLDYRGGRAGVFLGSGTIGNSVFYFPENLEIESGHWSTDGAGLTVTAYGAADPGLGYTACKLEKLAAGATPGRKCSFATQVWQGDIFGSIWLKSSDGSTHTAAIRLVTAGDLVSDQTQNVTVTANWQCFMVHAGPIAFAAGTSGYFEVYPVDPTSNPATGGVYAWGAQVSPESANATYPVSYCNVQPSDNGFRPGQITGSGVVAANGVTTGNGFIEVEYYNADDSPASGSIFCILPDGPNDLGGAMVKLDAGIRYMQVAPCNAAFSILGTIPAWDLRIPRQIYQRCHIMGSWDFSLNKTRIAVRGSAPGAGFDGVQSALWPRKMGPKFALGSITSGTFTFTDNFPPVVLEKFAVGLAPGLQTHGQSRMHAEAGIGKIYRVGALGDSITGFYDAWHAELSLKLGPKAIVVNEGISGNQTTDMIARFSDDIANRFYNDVIVMGGTNDLLIGGVTDTVLISRLQTLYNMIKATGARVIAMTILPFKGSPFGTYNATVEARRHAVNNWIISQPDPVDEVVNLEPMFNDGMDNFANFPTWTYDHVHPTHGVAGNPGPGSDLIGDQVFAQAYNSTPIP